MGMGGGGGVTTLECVSSEGKSFGEELGDHGG